MMHTKWNFAPLIISVSITTVITSIQSQYVMYWQIVFMFHWDLLWKHQDCEKFHYPPEGGQKVCTVITKSPMWGTVIRLVGKCCECCLMMENIWFHQLTLKWLIFCRYDGNMTLKFAFVRIEIRFWYVNL